MMLHCYPDRLLKENGVKDPLGIYIHVPFCLSKCPYCDFYSVKSDSSLIEAYVDAVCRAIKHSGEDRRRVDSVYFGGGTPSLLDEKYLSYILETLNRTFIFSEPEITLEANPAATLGRRLRGLRAAGVNRISFGVQSAVDAELSALGRLHTAGDAKRSILAAKVAGFENISADLMLGIPCETRGSLSQSIDFLTALPLTHISAYMLKIEEDTAFAKSGERMLCPDEDSAAEFYIDCVEALESKGFSQYEISNFAKKGKESRHNLKYWRCEEYLGIGPSAHSFINGRRFYTPRNLKSFIEAENPASLAVADGDGGSFEEYMMLRLRLCEGLNLTEAAKKFNVDTDKIAKKAAALEGQGLLRFKNNIISLTPKGFLLSNPVTANLLF